MVAVVDRAAELTAELAGVAVLAGLLAAVSAALYRWYVDEPVPGGLALLAGLAGVAVYLNATASLQAVIGGSTDPTETGIALFNITAFGAGAGGAVGGRRAGDRVAAAVVAAGSETSEDVGRLARTVGRITAIELPEEIDDAVGYDPVPDETKGSLAGERLLFPRGLDHAELRSRLVDRLRSDYAVGYVDLELSDDGTVEHLGLGSRAAGIGPTLPPATSAVAVRADPAFAASTGDIVQIWDTDRMRRIATAELRGVAGDVVTVAIDAADTTRLDPTAEYRLVTLPVEDRPDREFVSLLRGAEETFSSVTVAAGSPLHGLPVGGLDLLVIAVDPEDGQPEPLPPRDRRLEPGDGVYAIATADALRRLSAAADALDPALVRDTPDTDRTGAGATTAASTRESTADELSFEDDDTDPSGDAGDELTDLSFGTDEPGDDSDAPPSRGDDPDGANGNRDEDAEDAEDSGGKSFRELKEEFESGEADWDDDTDDSPGGDMRLDE